ncbi:MAG: hypothetical protein V1729_07075 [Candidatus Woesearchaeota archaeon]
MDALIVSNCIGTFLFKDNKIAAETLFSDAEVLSNHACIMKCEEIGPEKEMLAKNPGAEVLRGKVPPVQFLEQLSSMSYLKRMREASIIITKREIAESVRRDHLIIQASNNISEIDKVINTLAKRLREWYELYNPEFSKSIESHEKFAEIIQQKSRDELLNDIGLKKELSMGAEFSDEDLEPIIKLAVGITSLVSLRSEQTEYVEKLMKELMPNVNAVAGAMIGAKLLAHAGSLEKLSLFPASTVQLLGAEKALFRHIKTGSKSPKFGLIINHPLVSRAKSTSRGKAARMVADKISIAAKIDFFKGNFIGDDLRKALEEKLK